MKRHGVDPLKILVGEDEPDVMNVIDMILGTEGHEVVKASNGEDCLMKYFAEKRANRPFDLVISDLSMPKKDGLRVIREILHDNPNQRVILMTAYMAENMPFLADLQGKVKVVFKPFDVEDFVNAIKLSE